MSSLIKSLILSFLYVFRIWHILYWLKAKILGDKILVVFTYHRIRDVKDNREYYLNYDRGQDSDEFNNQIKAISEVYDVVGLEEFIGIVKGEIKPKNHTALITFDDADSEFLTQAHPILRKYNCPSVVFTPTAFVDSSRRFWHLRLSNAIENVSNEMWAKIKDDSDGIPESVKKIIDTSEINETKSRIQTCQLLVDELDLYNQDEIDSVIDKLEDVIGRRYTLGIECLSWDDQKKLTTEGVRFDSHTVNHGKLALLEPSEIKFELTESKKELEKILETEVLSICYPAGSFNEKVVELTPECGYSVGFTTQSGLCQYPINGKDLYSIPRLAVYGKQGHEIYSFLGKLLFGKFH